MRCILVDKNEAVRRLFQSVADDMHIEVQSVASSEEFRAKFATARTDAVIIDLQLEESAKVLEALHYLAQSRFDGLLLISTIHGPGLLNAVEELAHGLGLRLGAPLRKPLTAATIKLALTPAPTASWVPSLEEIRKGVLNDQVIIELQPIVEAHTRDLKRAEALVRWNHPLHGKLFPGHFLPIVSRDPALMSQLSLKVIDKAAFCCRALSEQWIRLQISVNLAQMDLQRAAFISDLNEIMRVHQLQPHEVSLEISQNILRNDLAAAAAFIIRMRAAGYDVALDDFGIGQDSEYLLRRCPFSSVKISPASFGGVTHEREPVRSLVTAAKKVGIRSVGVGVEDADQAQAFEQLGFDEMQGYYFSQSMKLDRFIEWERLSSFVELLLSKTSQPVPPEVNHAF